MSEFPEFYHSVAWKKCREAYMKKVGGLCERCFKKGLIVPAEVVHHKVHLNAKTVKDPRISLSFDNLEALCWSCHEKEHKGIERRYTVDAFGRVFPTE